MPEFFEIDFLAIEAKKSGDAITIRYSSDGKEVIHVVDGGFEETGNNIVEHLQRYYEYDPIIENVIVTHQDLDHTRGLRVVLEKCKVRKLWMLRPWKYSHELIEKFQRWRNVENLSKKLKEIYPNLVALEEIAVKKRIPIYDPFQGENIGEFLVLAPSKERYLELVADSEKTPEKISESQESFSTAILSSHINFAEASWGEENLSGEPTSCENEMSVVQYASLNGRNILLTGDAGVDTLFEAIEFLESCHAGQIPPIHNFQVPHHGSRRNLSSELLDQLFGEKLPYFGSEDKFTALISSSKDDPDHPRKAVIRALKHRGAKVLATNGSTICISCNAPPRIGWGEVIPLEYPYTQEE